MNYSTIKKVVACTMVTLVGLAATAQETTTTTSSTATVFGGRGQYRTWSIGVNAGVLSPIIPFGTNDYGDWNAELGYGAFLKKQLAPSFALKLDFHRGNISGDYATNEGRSPRPANVPASFNTELHYALALKGVVNVGTIDFLRRENAVNFFVQGGAGLAKYKAYPNAANEDDQNVRELYIPIGAGVNFKLGNRVALNLGYDANFLDADNLDGQWRNGASNKDKWSYGYAGLEFSLGSSAKPSLEWTNPVALMYDELKDPTLRQEVEALKTRVSTLENTVNQLSADADGDGVADRFDKCPGTPAGTVVDGSGCPLVHPETSLTTPGAVGSVIQFEFDSSVLKTSSYPVLDAVSAELRANSSSTAALEGHASAEGTDSYNMNLSRDRANSVKTYLVNSGVDANRLTVKAFGESRPVASNETEEGRIQNRRVEIKK
ncbi:OmpA family protein [Pedobacter sp. P351]|uniref:OmpA family protein n=1 Tax=Pedobacter superstes TaxID=3133441 RepID=UPI0030AAD8D5